MSLKKNTRVLPALLVIAERWSGQVLKIAYTVQRHKKEWLYEQWKVIRTAALFKTKYKTKGIQHLKTFPIGKVTMLKIIRQHILQALKNLNVMNSEALKGT